MTKRWKFLRKGFKSDRGNTKWKIGEWSKPIKNLEMCQSGYHCSKEIYQAFSYVQGEILALVECRGKHESQEDKETWETLKIVKAYKWQKKDSVALSIYAAELCIDNFEKVYPTDKRPREAIEAAKKFLKYPTKANRSAAWSAARSARFAAWSAAESAALSAESAAWSAAWSAALSARSAVIKKISKWMDKRLLVLKEIK